MLTTQLDHFLSSVIASGQIVGTVVLISHRGAIVYHKAWGFANRERQRAMAPDTLFRLSSLAKPIHIAALLQLIEQQKMVLDEPITTYLPQFKPTRPKGEVPIISLRHLLTHTAGLNYSFQEPAQGPYHQLGISDGLDASTLTLEENVKRLGQAPLIARPGKRWQYSLAIDVLGLVMEQVSGCPLPALITKHITQPLAMRDTAYTLPSDHRLARAYADAQPIPQPMTTNHQLPFGLSAIAFAPQRIFDAHAFPSAGSGMAGSAEDYHTFLHALNAKAQRFFTPKARSLLFTNLIGSTPVRLMGPGWGWSALGAIVLNSHQARTPLSPGTVSWGGVYGHSWWIDPHRELIGISLTNTAMAGMNGPFPEGIKRVVYQYLDSRKP